MRHLTQIALGQPIKGDYDGPGPRRNDRKSQQPYFSVADAPGYVPSKLFDPEYPLSVDINFYVYGRSKTEKKDKGEIWYDVNIAANGVGMATTNQIKETDQKIH